VAILAWKTSRTASLRRREWCEITVSKKKRRSSEKTRPRDQASASQFWEVWLLNTPDAAFGADNEIVAGLDNPTQEAVQQCKDLLQLTENALPGMSRLLLTSVHTNNLQSRIAFAMTRCVYFVSLITCVSVVHSTDRMLHRCKRVILVLYRIDRDGEYLHIVVQRCRDNTQDSEDNRLAKLLK